MSDLVSMLARTVREHGDRPAFGTRTEHGWSWMTYAEFGRNVDALRSGLATLGVGPGSRVGVISRNRVEWAIGCYAAAGLGAVYVPMYETQSERDWRHIVSDSGISVCLVSGSSIGARAAAAARGVETLRRFVDFDAPPGDATGYRGLMAYGEAHPIHALAPRPGDLAQIIYTSGTTGVPKGVLLTHSNIVSNVEAVIAIVPISFEDRSLGFLPWAHVFGGDELHGMIRMGASVAICEAVDKLVSELSEVHPTLLFAVPRVWNLVYQGVRKTLTKQPKAIRFVVDRAIAALHRERHGERLSWADSAAVAIARKLVFSRVRERFGGRLRLVVSSAAALAPEVAEFIDDLGIVVLEAYGATETSAAITINRPDDRRIGSVGKAIPGVRVDLDRNAPGAEGDSGEIVAYGHGVMAGYHNLPDQTAQVLTSDGGVRTGDLGRIDESGFLYITGRIKELYKLENGKYVAPATLEEQLTLSPFIAQACVFGANQPHNVALIVPHRPELVQWAKTRQLPVEPIGALLGHPQVQALFHDEIAARSSEFKGYERIKAFRLIEEPFTCDNGLLTPTLKVRRNKVRERYVETIAEMYAQAALSETRPRAASP